MAQSNDRLFVYYFRLLNLYVGRILIWISLGKAPKWKNDFSTAFTGYTTSHAIFPQ